MSVALTTLRGKSQTSQDDMKHDNNSSSDTESDGGGGDEGSKNPPASGTARHGNLSALEIEIKEKKNRLLDIQIQEKEDEAKNKTKTKKQRFCETCKDPAYIMKFLPYIFIIVLAGVAIGMVNKARYEIDEARREVDVTRDVVSSLVSQLEEQRRGFELLKEESKLLQNEFLRADNVSKKISQDIDFAEIRTNEILREAEIKATNVSQNISLELDLVQVRSSEILLEAQRKADNVSQSVSLELDKAQESSDQILRQANETLQGTLQDIKTAFKETDVVKKWIDANYTAIITNHTAIIGENERLRSDVTYATQTLQTQIKQSILDVQANVSSLAISLEEDVKVRLKPIEDQIQVHFVDRPRTSCSELSLEGVTADAFYEINHVAFEGTTELLQCNLSQPLGSYLNPADSCEQLQNAGINISLPNVHHYIRPELDPRTSKPFLSGCFQVVANGTATSEFRPASSCSELFLEGVTADRFYEINDVAFEGTTELFQCNLSHPLGSYLNPAESCQQLKAVGTNLSFPNVHFLRPEEFKLDPRVDVPALTPCLPIVENGTEVGHRKFKSCYELQQTNYTEVGRYWLEHGKTRFCNLTGEVIDVEMYVVSGVSGERYNPVTKQWEDVSGSMKRSRSGGVGLVVLTDPNDNKQYLYAVGGLEGSTYLKAAERYDPVTKQWEDVTSMKSIRESAGLVVLTDPTDNKQYIYAVGGYNGNANLNTAERYDPVTKQWEGVTSMKSTRGRPALLSLTDPTDNKQYIYAIGGQGAVGNAPNAYLNTAERYDPVTKQWEDVTSMMKSTRNNLEGVVFTDPTDNKQYIYAVGGYGAVGSQPGGVLNTAERYDPLTKQWEDVTSMKSARNGFGLVVMNDPTDDKQYIYAVGGDNTAERYDPVTKQWEDVTSMKRSRYGVGLVVLTPT